MPGSGEYRPGPTLGIDRPGDLPKTKISIRSYRGRPCPRCGHSAYRDRIAHRTLHDLGNPFTGRPRDIVLLYSQHDCRRSRKYFNADPSDLADPRSHYTRRVVETAFRLVLTLSLVLRDAMARSPRVRPLCHEPELGRGRGGKKAASRIDTEHLD